MFGSSKSLLHENFYFAGVSQIGWVAYHVVACQACHILKLGMPNAQKFLYFFCFFSNIKNSSAINTDYWWLLIMFGDWGSLTIDNDNH